MRCARPTKPRAERLVLLLYWLTSGYGLRASRALTWLPGILVLATILLAEVGLQRPATGSVVEATITYLGRLNQAALPFAGPILLGLALLSIRGRVKR
jgi:hypothetical protein